MRPILLLLSFFLLSPAFSSYVFMKETAQGKVVQLVENNKAPKTINQSPENEWALYPDIAPNGKEFLYVEGPGPEDLHLVYFNADLNLTQKFNLPTKGMLLHPKFSKNGQWIFYSAPGPMGKNVIYYFDRMALVAKQGTGLSEYSLSEAKILNEDHAYFPRPSSDGNFVVYQRNLNGKKEIILFDRIENKKIILADGMSPSLSFDERFIAYTSKVNGTWDIFTIDRFSGKKNQVTSGPQDEMAPTFTPENSIVFASNQSGRFHLYEMKNNSWIQLNTSNRSEVADFYSPQFSGQRKYKQKSRSNYIGNPRSSFGSVTHEGKIYVCGGHQGAEHTYPPESFSDMFIVYDIESNKWMELAPRPSKSHGYQIVARGNYIYAFGGFAYSPHHKPKWKSLDQIDRYDIKLNKWETIGKLNEPRSSNAAIEIADKVYIIGGWNSTPKFENDADGKFLNSIEIFDLKTEKIELASFNIPNPVRRAFTGIAHRGKLILIGGLGEGASHFELLNKVTEINPVDGSFKELAPLPFETFAPAAGVLGNELMVFGGMFKTGELNYEYVAHIYSMNLNNKKWSHTGRYLKETKGFSQVIPLDSKTLGILGGHHYFEGMDSPVTTFETISK